MGATGTATLDFGAFPGKSDTSVDVATGGVVVTSLVEAWIKPVATADHSADEHMLETIKVFGTYLSDGNIRIYGFNTGQQNETPFGWLPQGNKGGNNGKGTRIYGQWTIAWVWN